MKTTDGGCFINRRSSTPRAQHDEHAASCISLPLSDLVRIQRVHILAAAPILLPDLGTPLRDSLGKILPAADQIRSIAYRALARIPDSARHGCKRSRCHQSVFKSTVKTAEVSVWLKRVYCTEASNADEGYRRTADSTLHPPFVSTVSPIPQAQNSVKFGDVEILVNIE